MTCTGLSGMQSLSKTQSSMVHVPGIFSPDELKEYKPMANVNLFNLSLTNLTTDPWKIIKI